MSAQRRRMERAKAGGNAMITALVVRKKREVDVRYRHWQLVQILTISTTDKPAIG